MYMFVSLLRVKNHGKDTQFEMKKTAKFVWYNLLVFGQISWFFTRDLLVFQILEWHVCCNISCTLVDNKIVDYSDVIGALPVGTAPTTSSFST